MDSPSDNLLCCHVKRRWKFAHSVQASNGQIRILTKCAIFKINKSRFAKKSEEEIKPNTKQEISKRKIITETNGIHASVKELSKRKIILLESIIFVFLMIMCITANNFNCNYMLNVLQICLVMTAK